MLEKLAMSDEAKAAEEIARTTGKAIDAANRVGGFLAEFIREPLRERVGIITDNLKLRRWENMLDLQIRAQRKLAALGIDPKPKQIPLDIGVPLLEAASLVEDGDLRDRWANLIVNFAVVDGDHLPRRSFISVLTELSPLEVVILEKIYVIPNVESHAVLTGALPADAAIANDPPPGVPRAERSQPTPDVAVALSNLYRLGCLQPAKLLGGPDVVDLVYVTPFGRAFINACTLPQ
jgi:hypothetical protein